MKKGLTLLAFMSAAVITGCFSAYTFQEPYSGKKFFTYERSPEIENLRKVNAGKEITINRRLTWRVDTEKVKATTGLLPGKYREFSSNETGSLYFGEGRSYYLCATPTKCFLFVGGFWLPSSDNYKPKLFFANQGGESLEVSDIDAEAEKLQDPSQLSFDPAPPLIDLILAFNDPSFSFARSIDPEADRTFSEIVKSQLEKHD